MEESTSRSEDDTGEETEDATATTPSTVVSISSSNRDMRNKAEKSRRDRLNQFINELGQLVPMVAGSAKKLDKTSILRLSATFLRMHQTFVTGTKKQKDMPSIPGVINWCQRVLEGMDGLLLVLTSTGKIVFISHTVEALLGHPQIELLGQSLFNLTNPEDHDILKKNLKPNEEPHGSRSQDRSPQRKSFCIRLRQKAPRSELPQYELVHIQGHLRLPPPPSPRSHRGADTVMSNDAVLVAMMKPFKDAKMNAYSILEASKEEWVTRHLLDGQIVYADHRISLLSGYLSEEVTGINAFCYMHKDDVLWVMIALRQMYYRGQSFGNSCYRLMSRTGDYIYLRTYGYLEFNEDSNAAQSFICLNSIVTRQEGEKLIEEMKATFKPLLDCESDPASNAILGSNPPGELKAITLPSPSTNLDGALQGLLYDLPKNGVTVQSNKAPFPDIRFSQLPGLAKSFPPLNNPLPDKIIAKKDAQVRSPEVTLPDRETVLRVTQSSTNQVSVLPIEGCKLLSSVVVKPLTDAHQKRTSNSGEVPLEETSVKRLKIEQRVGVIVREQSPQLTPSGGGDSVVKSPPDPSARLGSVGETIGSVIRCGQELKHDLIEFDSALLACSASALEGFQPAILTAEGEIHFDPRAQGELLCASEINNELLQMPCLDFLADEQLQTLEIETNFTTDDLRVKTKDELEEGVVRSHRHLEDTIHYQGRQLSDIEQKLTAVPLPTERSQTYRNTFSHLKAEHRKQQQMLRNLQLDSMQHCKEQLSMRTAQPDIGV